MEFHGPDKDIYFNYTHVAVLIFGKHAATGTYYVNLTGTNTTLYAILLSITADELKEGYYYENNVPIPTLPSDSYDVNLVNVTSGSKSTLLTLKWDVRIVPSAVFHSETLGTADMNIYRIWLFGHYVISPISNCRQIDCTQNDSNQALAGRSCPA